ncbi:MAG: hypothetical protein U5Q44_14690 [Dehalococcoidia bacterium]|nr:hypothetical protein [Dehalococcoidia bacterium]
MKRRQSVAAIDLGSTKVTVIVGDRGDGGETRILGVGVAPASGLTRGVIDNIQSAREAVATAVEKAEQSCGMRILSATGGDRRRSHRFAKQPGHRGDPGPEPAHLAGRPLAGAASRRGKSASRRTGRCCTCCHAATGSRAANR